MMLKAVVALLVCVFCILGDSCVLCSRRDVTKQLTRLEKRYDLEYSLIKEDINDLWASVEQTNAKCCTTGITSSNISNNNLVHEVSTINTTNYNNIIRRIKLAFTEEKKYLREQSKGRREELNKVKENWEDTFEELSNFNVNLMTTCEDANSDIKQIREQAAELSDRLDTLETKTSAQINDLSTLMNSVVEETKYISSLHRPASCMELIKAGVKDSGVYQLFYANQPFIVFCLMLGNHGYTFISPETYMNIDIKSLSNDQSHVIIRHRRTNGAQYHTRIEQLTRYKSRSVSVQYNNHVGYKGPANWLLSPYVYVGINPLGGNQKGQTQGYKSNGKDVQFTNCDNNPNGYFVFLFNHGGKSFHSNGYSPAVARQWVDTATLVTKDKVPDKFMSQFELHFGGCGAFATNGNLRGVDMAAVGIPYTI